MIEKLLGGTVAGLGFFFPGFALLLTLELFLAALRLGLAALHLGERHDDVEFARLLVAVGGLRVDDLGVEGDRVACLGMDEEVAPDAASCLEDDDATVSDLRPAVDHAIGVPGEISAGEASCFVGSFYRGLGFGYSVDRAYHLAVAALALESDGTPGVVPEMLGTGPSPAGSLLCSIHAGSGRAHPLHRIPRGPIVPSHFITDELLGSYAELFDTPPTMRTALNNAVSMRQQADPGASVVRFGDVPQPAYGAYQFWEAVFFEARKHGPRMVASLLDLTSDDDRIGDGPMRDRKTLLHYLEKGA